MESEARSEAGSPGPGTGGAARFSLAGKSVLITGATGALGSARRPGAGQGRRGAHPGRRQRGGPGRAGRGAGGRAGRRGDRAPAAGDPGRRRGDGPASRCGRTARLDGVLVASGMNHVAPITAMDVGDFQRVQDANVRGSWLVCQAAGRQLIEQGRGGSVVLVSSTRGRLGHPAGYSAYCPSKAAVDLLARSLAAEWGPAQIRVNAIAPTVFRSDLTAWMYADDERGPGHPGGDAGPHPAGPASRARRPDRRRSSSCSATPRPSSPARCSTWTAATRHADRRSQPRQPRPRLPPGRRGWRRADGPGHRRGARGRRAGRDAVRRVARARVDEAVAAARPRYAGPPAAGRSTGSTDLPRAVTGADLVVEAVVEDLAVKQEVFAAVSAAAPAAVLATNTSVLPVTAIAERAHRAGAGPRHPLVEPAGPDPGGRGDPRPADLRRPDRPGDGAAGPPRQDAGAGPAGRTRDSSATGCSTPCGARRSPWSRTASATRRRWTWWPGTPSGCGWPGWARSRTPTTWGWT